jgi:hypothetical protein
MVGNVTGKRRKPTPDITKSSTGINRARRLTLLVRAYLPMMAQLMAIQLYMRTKSMRKATGSDNFGDSKEKEPENPPTAVKIVAILAARAISPDISANLLPLVAITLLSWPSPVSSSQRTLITLLLYLYSSQLRKRFKYEGFWCNS